MSSVPVVLCFDLEPDRRALDGFEPEPCLGFEKLVGLVPALRDRLSTGSGTSAAFTWCVRIDPQVERLYGTPTALAERYERNLSIFRADGDEIGVHPHSWRWKDRWVSDEADAAWVADCIGVGLDGYHQFFGEPCRVHKHGDRFMSTAVARQLDRAGVMVDLSVEPGLHAVGALSPTEETTGWLPDTTTVPSRAYRPSRDDFRTPDPDRRDGLVLVPLSAGLTFAYGTKGNRALPTASAQPLSLWLDPLLFRAMLRVRIDSPGLTHLAFAVRSDTALSLELWDAVEENLSEVQRQLGGRAVWRGATEVARRAIGSDATVEPREETADQVAARGWQWLRGTQDRGFLERVDVDVLDLHDGHPLMSSAPAAVAPSVSVVLPVYGGSPHLREAVDSVVHQTQPPAELVVVNDGSRVDDLEFLHGVTAPFPIRILHQANVGQLAARNRGSRAAHGELLAFLDQDDGWHPRHLALLGAPFADDPDVVWSYSDFDEIDGEGRDVTRGYLREHGIVHPKTSLIACLERDLMVVPSAIVIRRSAFEALGGFDEELRGYEDDDLYVRAFRAGGRFVFHDDALTRYRVHAAGDSAGPRFAESRGRFSNKLRATVPDDPRTGRHCFRDVVAPRFFAASLDDYVRAVSAGDWVASETALTDLRRYARLRRDRVVATAKVACIQNPRLFRSLLRAQELLPRGWRLRNPVIRLR